ncbi:hypothetical protein [Dactylosporangium sp. CS-033363]|uniref:hypothetical protein n=1 Tax=Dactylosporangium sp. CS-033363 TaxID=3239935 RepID=UPI003D90769A
MAPARAGLAPDGGAAPMIRALAHWANAAMVAVAAAALLNLGMAFLPLADLHAVHHPGPETAALATTLRLVGWAGRAVLLLTAALVWIGWVSRARSNLVAFGVRSHRVVDSVGRAPEPRRHMTLLTWAFWGTSLVGAATLLVAWLAGRETAAEIGLVRTQARDGRAVDDALAGHLFGRELLLYLPSAALFVLAAGFAVLIVAHVTSAQYGRVARLRARDSVLAEGGTIRA